MKVVQINVTCGNGSTGKICVAVSKLLSENGIENYILYSNGKSDYSLGIKYQSDRYRKIQGLWSRILGNYGFNAWLSTRKLIKHLKRIKPDIVHLHNLHSHNGNLSRLFSFFRKEKIKLFWTFHDCWAFTGYCPHFDRIGCTKWQSECHDCSQCKRFSWFFDRSRCLYQKKKLLFNNQDLTIVTPSQWVADLVKNSFLKHYPIQVINNGINLSVFQPRESDFRKRYSIEDKFIVLGVAFNWGYSKGLDVFIELANRLDSSYQIILVGTNEQTDKLLPENILSIYKTQNQIELAQIYSAANVLVNPTREDTFPTVNMEALACGIPVITFRTGGSPEIIDEHCGLVVEKEDIDGLEKGVRLLKAKCIFSKADCLQRAQKYNENEKFKEYMRLYEEEN